MSGVYFILCYSPLYVILKCVVVVIISSVAIAAVVVLVIKRRNVKKTSTVPVPETGYIDFDLKVSWYFCDAIVIIMTYFWYRIKPLTVRTVGI